MQSSLNSAGPVSQRICRRYPPAVLFMGVQAHPLDPKQQQPVVFSSFPIVQDGWTCGEHDPVAGMIAAN